jgi:hypothetical protein
MRRNVVLATVVAAFDSSISAAQTTLSDRLGVESPFIQRSFGGDYNRERTVSLWWRRARLGMGSRPGLEGEVANCPN